MSLNIDLNGIKNGVIAAYHTVATTASEWLGRAIIVIKSKTDIALPYLQDQRIAAASLVAVSLLFGEMSNLFSSIVNKCLPDETETQAIFRDAVDIVGGIAIPVAGITAFAKHTQLPFSPGMIFAISATTIVARALLSTESKVAIE